MLSNVFDPLLFVSVFWKFQFLKASFTRCLCNHETAYLQCCQHTQKWWLGHITKNQLILFFCRHLLFLSWRLIMWWLFKVHCFIFKLKLNFLGIMIPKVFTSPLISSSDFVGKSTKIPNREFISRWASRRCDSSVQNISKTGKNFSILNFLKTTSSSVSSSWHFYFFADTDVDHCIGQFGLSSFAFISESTKISLCDIKKSKKDFSFLKTAETLWQSLRCISPCTPPYIGCSFQNQWWTFTTLSTFFEVFKHKLPTMSWRRKKVVQRLYDPNKEIAPNSFRWT